MSIIFQLFSAEDLRKFDINQLNGLRDKILSALEKCRFLPDNDEKNQNRVGETLKNKIERLEGKLLLNLTEKVDPTNTLFSGDPDFLNFAHQALLKRFYEVSHQLKTPPRSSPDTEFLFDTLVNGPEAAKKREVEERILNWATSCELNHLEFYYALAVAKKAAEEYINSDPVLREQFLPVPPAPALSPNTIEQAKIRIKDPDSTYSPFNPRHPLSRQYYNVSKLVSEESKSYTSPPTEEGKKE